MSLTEDGTIKLRRALMQRVPRSVVLVPSDRDKEEVVSDVRSIGLTVFDATAIEDSKDRPSAPWVQLPYLENRYDGIDFPGDECTPLLPGWAPEDNERAGALLCRADRHGRFGFKGRNPDTRCPSGREMQPIVARLFGGRRDGQRVDGLSKQSIEVKVASSRTAGGA